MCVYSYGFSSSKERIAEEMSMSQGASVQSNA